MNRNNKIFTLFCLLSVLLLTPLVENIQANTFSDGYNHYISGRFQTALTHFIKLYKKSNDPFAKAKNLKMAGICYFMLGKISKAKYLLSKSLKLNPNIKINKNEVLDEGVVEIFNELKNSKHKPAGTAKNNSYLIVKSNTKATIIIDGNISAKTNEKIPISTGFHEVELTAIGYHSVIKPVEVKKGGVNKIFIQMQKDKNHEDEDEDEDEPYFEGHKKTKTAVDDKKFGLVDLMPLGVPQFQHNNYLSGSLFLAAQTISIAAASYYWYSGNSIADHADEEIVRRENEARLIKDVDERDLEFRRISSYRNSEMQKRDDSYNVSEYAVWIFGATWLASVISGLVSGEINKAQVYQTKKLDETWSSKRYNKSDKVTLILFPHTDNSKTLFKLGLSLSF